LKESAPQGALFFVRTPGAFRGNKVPDHQVKPLSVIFLALSLELRSGFLSSFS
jgi:hypothetical protein